MDSRKPIERGNLVRKTVEGRDYYGTALTSESHRGRLKVRVEWCPDFGTWEQPDDLTVISVLAMRAS